MKKFFILLFAFLNLIAYAIWLLGYSIYLYTKHLILMSIDAWKKVEKDKTFDTVWNHFWKN